MFFLRRKRETRNAEKYYETFILFSFDVCIYIRYKHVHAVN